MNTNNLIKINLDSIFVQNQTSKLTTFHFWVKIIPRKWSKFNFGKPKISILDKTRLHNQPKFIFGVKIRPSKWSNFILEKPKIHLCTKSVFQTHKISFLGHNQTSKMIQISFFGQNQTFKMVLISFFKSPIHFWTKSALQNGPNFILQKGTV